VHIMVGMNLLQLDAVVIGAAGCPSNRPLQTETATIRLHSLTPIKCYPTPPPCYDTVIDSEHFQTEAEMTERHPASLTVE